jgi:hypothetical protein
MFKDHDLNYGFEDVQGLRSQLRHRGCGGTPRLSLNLYPKFFLNNCDRWGAWQGSTLRYMKQMHITVFPRSQWTKRGNSRPILQFSPFHRWGPNPSYGRIWLF